MENTYIPYIHNDSNINTISDFIDAVNPYVEGITSTELLNFGNGVTTNLEQIWNCYSESEQKENQSSYNSKTLTLLKVGTLLFLPSNNTNREMLEVIGVNRLAKTQDVKAFVSEKLKAIQDSPFYKNSNILKGKGGKYDIQTIYNNCQIWVYCRSLNRIIDITSFVSSVNTSVAANGGSFSIQLSPASDIFENLYTQKDIINYTDININRQVNESWFVKNFQTNDIFFIKFEKLLGESRDKIFDVSKTSLPNQIYDMIGLMDNISVSYSPNLNEMNVNVQGRDFMKMLTEDGSFFHPYVYIEGALESFFIQMPDQDKYFQRMFTDGQFKTLFTLGFKSIKNALSFVLNQLVNSGISTDNDLFSAYTDKAEPYNVDSSDLSNVKVNGIYQIIHLVVDNQLDDKMVVNDGISNPNGKLLDHMLTVCQQPFVEFYGDTYGDSYNYIARQPPFVEKSVQDYIQNHLLIEIQPSQVYDFSFAFHTEYYSLYQLKPENSFLGKSNTVALAHFPAIIIPPFIDAFGNNRMIISSNYISYKALTGSSEKESKNVNLFRKVAIQDLLYLIGSTIYLPFTRKGSITIKGGDRRIKRGNWIYFEPTDEYYYVTSVTNSMRVGKNDLDRETVIQVERGMKKDYVFGKTISLESFKNKKDLSIGVPFSQSGDDTRVPPNSPNQINFINRPPSPKKRFTKSSFEVSYFNLIDTKTLENKLTNFGVANNDQKLESIINNNVFNFFMLKLQFDESL